MEGLKATVLTLQWPVGVNPAKLSNFETEARALRYRALGTACRGQKIRALLLAHHEDDVAESIMRDVMSINSPPVSWRIRPMKANASNIPECWGLYGLHRSGNTKTIHQTIHQTDGSMICEHGGVKIYRPLLSFSKAQIRATCHAYGLEWVEDETNHDVTKTVRNAIRSLLQNERLPKALTKERLLALHDRVRVRIGKIENCGLELFQRADIVVFDLRSGGLAVRLPQQPLDDRLGIMAFLRRLFEIVSPKERISVSNFDTALGYMYGEMQKINNGESKNTSMSFCTADVHAQRTPKPLAPSSDGSLSHRLDPKYIWTLTRQPFPRKKHPVSISIPRSGVKTAPDSGNQVVPHDDIQHGHLHVSEDIDSMWSSWKLWDGRFWIRVCNRTEEDLEVRAFSPKDFKVLKCNVSRGEMRSLRYKLSLAAPGDVRFTLPVIAQISSPGEIAAFRTLNQRLGSVSKDLKWEVRYKDVDFGFKREGGWKVAR